MIISWDAVDWPLSVLAIYLLFPMLGLIVVYFDEKAKGKPNRASSKFLVGGIVLCLSGILLMFAMLIIPAIGPWEELKRGKYEGVEYTDTRHQTSHGSTHTHHKTIIHFSDGQTMVLDGEYDIGFPKGAVLKIMTKNSHYKILKAE